MNLLILEFAFYFYVKRDGLDCVNVKEFWLLFLTRESTDYF